MANFYFNWKKKTNNILFLLMRDKYSKILKMFVTEGNIGVLLEINFIDV